MADVIEDTVNLLELAAIGVVAYLLYKVYQLGSNFNFCDMVPESLQTTLGCLPTNTALEKQLQQAGGQPGGVGGFDGTDINGQMWSCTGGTNSSCIKVTCDSNANCTPNGPAVPQSTITFPSSSQSSLIGSSSLW
jgi:hypothetical protein